MKNLTLFFIVLVFGATMFTSCRKEEDPTSGFKIEGLTVANFPKLDGSTSNEPLNRIIASKLLGYNYEWTRVGEMYSVKTEVADLVKTSQTHNSFINLMDGEADIILSARKMSPGEKAHADSVGVTLVETPIALDAFVFIVNPKNPVTSLTRDQIVDIYTQTVVNWHAVGGNDTIIFPYVRNQNSGSQELMESLVMRGTPIADLPVDLEITSMLPVFLQIRLEENSICYTVHYYKEKMVTENTRNAVKTIAINGVAPSKKTIANRQYPFVAEVYAIIRSDLDKNSMAYKLYELLQTTAGKNVIAESGYIPISG
ncbi:MAG: substrate-binding domain-containing protein [Odoribacteraceae bacterium]|nr:substrate-binding domain-containing protein [Odoribacteraceae bacterium]